MKRFLIHKSLTFAHEAVLALLLVGLMVFAARAEPRFVTAFAQQRLSSHIWETALLALPMTLIIISGGIDLSVGSAMALASVVLGILYKDFHCPLPLACIAALFTGALCGLINGAFITAIKVHPLVVTLATMSAFRGLAEAVGRPDGYSGFPDVFYTWQKAPSTGASAFLFFTRTPLPCSPSRPRVGRFSPSLWPPASSSPQLLLAAVFMPSATTRTPPASPASPSAASS
jgi:ribose/xylose/arabinose/galactoside ABC-type transport system permease subunit